MNINDIPGTDYSITLRDGRNLSYRDYGNKEDFPVFIFHGNPGSRLIWGMLPDYPYIEGIRIIAPDRPGYGLSDFNGNALLDWPSDMEELADTLGIKKFSLMAASGGTPYVLACAWKIPDRIHRAGVVSGVGPNVKEATRGALKSLKVLWTLGNILPCLVRLQMRLMAKMALKDSKKVLSLVEKLEIRGKDKEFNEKHPEIMSVIADDFAEAYKKAGTGSAFDSMIPGNWPVPLEAIEKKVYLWHTTEDELTGNMTAYMASKIKNSVLTTIENYGHLWILSHMKDVLEVLVRENGS